MAGNLPSIKFVKGGSRKSIVPGVCVFQDKYKFYCNKVLSDEDPVTLFYQCGMKKNTKCTASLVLTKVEEKWWPKSFSTEHEHNHPPEPAELLASLMKKEMYKKVQVDPEARSDDVYRDVVVEYEEMHGQNEDLWDEAIAILPGKDNISRHMRKLRQKEYGPLPNNRNDFHPKKIIEETVGGYKVDVLDSNDIKDKSFYIGLQNFKGFPANSEENEASDNPSNTVLNRPGNLVDYSISSEDSEDSIPLVLKPKRILAYTTKKLLKLFEQRKASSDGTFKISPTLWKQIYIIMIKFGNFWIPVLYALLPDKTKDSYFTLFYMIKKKLEELDIPFNIESVRMDFEVGAMRAAAIVWKVDPKGCYFHYTQDSWLFVQNNNMASAYLNGQNYDLKKFIKCMLALPHVPVDDLEETLLIILHRDWEFEADEEMNNFKEKFLSYVHTNWMDGIFPPRVWNCFSRKVDLTNNNIESHNHYLNQAIKEAHPSPARLTVALVKELTLAEIKLSKVKSGAERVIRKKYAEMNKRREKLKSMYGRMDRIDYLSQIGNIVMHIQLNKRQMTELRQAGADDAPHEDNSEEKEDTGFDSSHSLPDVEDRYAHREIGITARVSNRLTEGVPEYKGKKCYECKGKFNKRSKYQVCKFCDRFVHVNNNKKCLKMKTYEKSVNFICRLCEEVPDNPSVEVSDEEADGQSNEEMSLHDQSSSTSTKYTTRTHSDTDTIEPDNENNGDLGDETLDLTIDGVSSNGLVFEHLDTPLISQNEFSASIEAHSTLRGSRKLAIQFVDEGQEHIADNLKKIRRRRRGVN